MIKAVLFYFLKNVAAFSLLFVLVLSNQHSQLWGCSDECEQKITARNLSYNIEKIGTYWPASLFHPRPLWHSFSWLSGLDCNNGPQPEHVKNYENIPRFRIANRAIRSAHPSSLPFHLLVLSTTNRMKSNGRWETERRCNQNAPQRKINNPHCTVWLALVLRLCPTLTLLSHHSQQMELPIVNRIWAANL